MRNQDSIGIRIGLKYLQMYTIKHNRDKLWNITKIVRQCGTRSHSRSRVPEKTLYQFSDLINFWPITFLSLDLGQVYNFDLKIDDAIVFACHSCKPNTANSTGIDSQHLSILIRFWSGAANKLTVLNLNALKQNPCAGFEYKPANHQTTT